MSGKSRTKAIHRAFVTPDVSRSRKRSEAIDISNQNQETKRKTSKNQIRTSR